MSDVNDRSTGLLGGGDRSSQYSYMADGGGAGEGLWYKLRYRSPQLVLPLLIAFVVAVLAAIALLVVDVHEHEADSSSPSPPPPQSLHAYVSMERANVHLNGLQRAADKGNGTRQSRTVGYNASVDYVVSVLQNLTHTLTWRLQPWTEAGRSGINVIADTLTGNPENTVVMGGHLDSVSPAPRFIPIPSLLLPPAADVSSPPPLLCSALQFGGPGLNDDGSGSVAVMLLAEAVNAAILDGALQLTNRIRFHWYDAEEAGLLGSHAAVSLGINATDVGERLKDWVCQLQADMVAAPNYILALVDPTYFPPNVNNKTIAGSHVMAGMFRKQFTALGYPYRNISTYHEQSDQWSYWQQGVPAGFGITGVFERHTAADVRDFGGILGLQADAQIHSPRDNILNVNLLAQFKMTRMYAGVLQQLVMDANIRQTLFVTHGEGELQPAPMVAEQWEEIIDYRKATGTTCPANNFDVAFPPRQSVGCREGAGGIGGRGGEAASVHTPPCTHSCPKLRE